MHKHNAIDNSTPYAFPCTFVCIKKKCSVSIFHVACDRYVHVRNKLYAYIRVYILKRSNFPKAYACVVWACVCVCVCVYDIMSWLLHSLGNSGFHTFIPIFLFFARPMCSYFRFSSFPAPPKRGVHCFSRRWIYINLLISTFLRHT